MPREKINKRKNKTRDGEKMCVILKQNNEKAKTFLSNFHFVKLSKKNDSSKYLIKRRMRRERKKMLGTTM